MHFIKENHIALSQYTGQKTTGIHKTFLLDFLIPDTADWLDKSQAFIPYTAWFETANKSIVDFPREHIFSFLDSDNLKYCSSFEVGDIYSFFFRASNVYYHGSLLSLRPLIWYFSRKGILSYTQLVRRNIASFGLRRQRKRKFSSMGGLFFYIRKKTFRFFHFRKLRTFKFFLKRLKDKKRINSIQASNLFFKRKTIVSFFPLQKRNLILQKFFINTFWYFLHIDPFSKIHRNKKI